MALSPTLSPAIGRYFVVRGRLWLMSNPALAEHVQLVEDLMRTRRELGFGSLCTALTEPTIQGRVLGVSKNATVSTSSMFLSSGNNVGPVRDMARRVITIRLDLKVENPALR